MQGSIGARARLTAEAVHRPGPIAGRGQPEVAPERAREHLMTAEPGAARNTHDRLGTRDQLRCGALEPPSLRVLLRCLAGYSAESAMEVEWRPAGLSRQRIERKVVVKATADAVQQLEDVVLCRHR